MGLKVGPPRSKGGRAFDKAFAAARKNPKAKTFTFGGKSYSTALAPTGLAALQKTKPKGASTQTAAADVPRPKPRPDTTAANVPLPKPRPDYTPDVPRPAPSKTVEIQRIAEQQKGKPLPPAPNQAQLAGNVSSAVAAARDNDTARLAAARARAAAANPARTAADIADTRKRMELATGSPSPRGTAVRTASVKSPMPVTRPTQVEVASNTQPLATATRVQPVTGYAKVVGREVTPPSSKMARTGPRLGSPEPMAAAPPVRQPAKFYVGKRIAPDVVKTTRVAAQKGDRKVNAKASTFSTSNGPHDYSRLKFFHPGKG
jgi:hypothetical protein